MAETNEATKSLFKKIQKIQIQAAQFASGVLAGAYRSAFKGKGMEFEEVREYLPGDDFRDIDWHVTARMRHPYVKSFREERDLSVTLAVDISNSTKFGSKNTIKSDLIAEIAAVIAFSAIKNNDKVALILFTDKVEKYLPPKKGTRHVLRVIRELLTYTPKNTGTNIKEALKFLGNVQIRSGVCFLISDFNSLDFMQEAAIISKQHELIPVAVIDPIEKQFPQMNLVTFEDLESQDNRILDTSKQEFQQNFINNSREKLLSLLDKMLKIETKVCVIETDKPFAPQLTKYFTLKKREFR